MKKNCIQAAMLLCMCISLPALGQVGTAPSGAKGFGRPVIKCASSEYEKSLHAASKGKSSAAGFEEWLAPKVAAAKAQRLQKDGMGANQTLIIPVVVHVVHNGDPVGVSENIAEEQVLSQIEVLNQDFRKLQGTPGYNNHTAGADMEVYFCLAKRTPEGENTTGIIRHNLGSATGWNYEDVNAILKPATQWDPEAYLNIWVVDYIYFDTEDLGGQGEIAGFAQFPDQSGLEGLEIQSPADQDGVVIGHRFFGSADIYPEGVYDAVLRSGRTTTHELGHFFGLRHIWGDVDDCTTDDYCVDTPMAFTATIGCDPADSCPDSPGADMIENYMDYTDDACKNIFTLNQKDRLMAVMQNSPRRANLSSSTGCAPTEIYSNDATLRILHINNASCSATAAPEIVLQNTGITPLTSANIHYYYDGNTPMQLSWGGNLAPGTSTTFSLPQTQLAPGVRTLNMLVASVNGVEDQNSVNDTKTMNFVVSPKFDTQEITIEIKPDTAGDNLYVLSSATGVLAIEGPFEQANTVYTHTVPVQDGVCYTLQMIDLTGDGLGSEGYYKIIDDEGSVLLEGGDFGRGETMSFGIEQTLGGRDAQELFAGMQLYPNPSNNIINLEIPNGVAAERFSITNALGQLIEQGAITGNRHSVDINAYANGIYFIKVSKDNRSATLRFIKY